MFRCFKRDFESEIGTCTLWMEFDITEGLEGSFQTRDVQVCGETWFYTDDPFEFYDGGGGLCDQPLSSMDDDMHEYEISREEFEQVWAEALGHKKGRTAIHPPTGYLFPPKLNLHEGRDKELIL